MSTFVVGSKYRNFKSKFQTGNTPIMRRIANSNFGKRAFKVLGEAVKVGADFVSIGFGIWDFLRGTKVF